MPDLIIPINIVEVTAYVLDYCGLGWVDSTDLVGLG